MHTHEITAILDLLEELNRCARAQIAGVTVLCIGDERLAQLDALVKRHRPVPYHLEGGRRYRGNSCIDTAPEEYTTTIHWWVAEGIEPDEIGVWLVRHTCPMAEVEEQLRAAIIAFLTTDDGRAAAESIHGDFNWGDAVTKIPVDHWQRYGIIAIDSFTADQSLVVRHDDTFTTEDATDEDADAAAP
jgi:hypothetical protein